MSFDQIKKEFNSTAITKEIYIQTMFEEHKRLFDYPNLLKACDISNIEITDKGVVFTTKKQQLKFFCDFPDMRQAALEILNFNDYEPSETNMFLSFLKQDDVFFDIGANVGWFSLAAAKSGKLLHCYAFEPVGPIFKNLKRNIELNAYSDLIQPYNFGFADKAGSLEFFYDKTFSGKSSKENLIDSPHLEKVSVDLVMLDAFIKEHNIQKIDFIKCDVEGGELSVLKGATYTLEHFQPIVMMELLRKWSKKFGYHPNEVIDLFASLGYKCFSIQEDKLHQLLVMDESTVETNFIFLHTIKHHLIIDKFNA
jgi:FkbM family methyltransferase